MKLDPNLRLEVLSEILGKEVKASDQTQGTADNVLSVDEFHLSNILGTLLSLLMKVFINEDDFFDPQYDYDFSDPSELPPCERGNEPYARPYGWYRIALKVKGKYPDGDKWLGSNGLRSHSDPGEWPVSFHGTSLDGAKGIITRNYKAGPGALYGRGIYSTPDINVAEELYARTFQSKTTRKHYKVILQNRINPQKREICTRNDYWLIPVPQGAPAYEERRIVTSSIRPYGILIKELNQPSCVIL
ncbi:uncharacterized protein LOC143000513 [Genypterus blacodes]|uniref:uncharacterized protein LOC143000513 n=1 Tax=Genypterus blacodes TaxID=154954 RepID=UPI003F776AA4